MLNIEEYKHQAETCVRCSFCKLIDMNYIKSARFSRQCPIDTRYKFNLYSPHGLLHAAIAELDSKLEFTPKLIDALWHCTLCGGCDSRCKRNLDVEVLYVIEGLRQRYIEQGNAPLPRHQEIIKNIKATHNIYGAAHEDRFKWLSAEIKPSPKADILFFVDDAQAYHRKELAQACVNLLNKAGVNFMVLQDEWSSGHQLFGIGQLGLAKEMAGHNIRAIQDTGANIVITSDAECYKTLKVDYPRVMDKATDEMPYKVLHITEYIDQLFKEGKIKFENIVPIKVTYHDPCNLGRLSEPWYNWKPQYLPPNIAVGKTWRRAEKGVYEPPRNILKAIKGLELVEMERHHDNAWCCGYGGGVGSAFPDFAKWTAMERVKEAKATGASAIVSCCPYCKDMLGGAAMAQKLPTKVYDITEIMLLAMK
jgi:heterodisulfide reductase subunit D